MGSNAFRDCSSLTDLDFAPGIGVLGDWMFSRCISLQTVTVPAGIANVGEGVFAECQGLESAVIGSSGVQMFSGSLNLRTLTVPEEAASVHERALEGHSSLKTVIIAGPADIGARAFDGCTALTNLKMTGDVKRIGDMAFADCSELTALALPDSVEHIGDSAFMNCFKMTIAKLPASLRTVGSGAFVKCFGITELVLPHGTESVGTDAFKWCGNISSVRIGCGSVSLGLGALSDCGDVEKLVFDSGSVSTEGDPFEGTVFKNLEIAKGTVFGGDMLFPLEEYRFTLSDKNLSNIVKDIMTVTVGKMSKEGLDPDTARLIGFADIIEVRFDGMGDLSDPVRVMKKVDSGVRSAHVLYDMSDGEPVRKTFRMQADPGTEQYRWAVFDLDSKESAFCFTVGSQATIPDSPALGLTIGILGTICAAAYALMQRRS